ncbi:MAG: hypothetical protein Q7R31_02125 [Candidatus Levybacteria bacterium]|nr:hypothetical protein [Candidatus Levybacteria bacterium]
MVERQSLAFRHEFYEEAKEHQIRDDLVSYLGEYRFEVSEFNYRLGISNGILVDPNTGESMSLKAKRAIEFKRRRGLNTSREEAEFEGFINLEQGLSKKPFGVAVWLSPPGQKAEGCGDYGFAFVGKRNGNELEMTAIRLENPTINDFNKAANALWGEKGYEKVEDLLRQPMVIDISLDKVKEFIHGNFEIKDEQSKTIFGKALDKLSGIIDEVALIIKTGTSEQKQKAFHTLENLAIELKERLGALFKENVIFMSDYRISKLATFMGIDRYTNKPKLVAGSCGSTSDRNSLNSSNVFSKYSSLNGLLSLSEDNEWFTCPKCNYKATGPVGDECPKCHITKEEFAESGAEVCD